MLSLWVIIICNYSYCSLFKLSLNSCLCQLELILLLLVLLLGRTKLKMKLKHFKSRKNLTRSVENLENPRYLNLRFSVPHAINQLL